MILQLFDVLRENPPAFFVYLGAIAIAMVTGIAFHEFSHAWAANELGDDTAARQGRLTLNPLAHLDPLGTVLLFIVGVGWGKPTPVNPYRLSAGVKRGNMLVALAGPLSNFAFAFIASIPLIFGWVEPIGDFGRIEHASGSEILGTFLLLIGFLNVILGVFNLIPIHPLDGFKVLLGVLPDGLSQPLASLSRWGPALLIGLIVVSFVAPEYSPLRWIFNGAIDLFLEVIT
ncbi:MAG: site-2 protease family protein [Dehalococcoidia bacterium]|nr:site-2 protease family protein [Dehalococcoidia bacterium]